MSRWNKFKAIVTGLLLTIAPKIFAQAPQYVEGEVIVKLKNRVGIKGMGTFASKPTNFGKVSIQKSYSSLRIHHMKVNVTQTVEQTIDELQNDPDVEYVEPNYVFGKLDIQNPGHDQIFSAADVSAMAGGGGGGGGSLVTTAPIQYTQAWGLLGPNTAIPIIAVIDTGVERSHPVFVQSGAIWVNPYETAGNGIDDDGNGYVDDVNGWNFVSNNNNPDDDEGHGTHVAGTILGITQDIFTAPYAAAKVRIMPLKFLDNTGSGSTSSAINAIYYASNNGARILNNSWGGSGYSQALKDAIAYSYTKKSLFVAAAGNASTNNDSMPMYPASYDVPNIVSVAATTPGDAKAWFSNFGANTVHVGSPGTSIFSTWPGGTWKYSDGTSMATPVISGIAAEMMHEKPDYSGYQIKSLLFQSSEYKSSLSSYTSQKSRVNAYGAVYTAQTGTPPTGDPNYIASNPYRDVASAGAGSCGRVHKMGGGSNIRGFGGGNWTPTNSLLVFILLMPLLISLFLKQRNPADLRKHERYKIHSAVTLNVDGKDWIGEVSTISLGGAKVDTSALLKNGGVVTLTIASPDGKESIQVQGQVVWSEANKHYGVQFANADQGVLSKISSWTQGLIKI